MAENVNYQKELEKIIAEGAKKYSLLMHACCAPCSSYVLEYLDRYFDMDMFYFNPNIDTADEYNYRQSELVRLSKEMPLSYPVKVMTNAHEPELFKEAIKGVENTGEGGERCSRCFEMRLRRTALEAREKGYDYFGTTLTISPMKNARKINELGEKISQEIGVKFLPSDFKKKNGYKRSIELSKQYELYRQNYCGCAYSKAESLKRQEKSQSCDT